MVTDHIDIVFFFFIDIDCDHNQSYSNWGLEGSAERGSGGASKTLMNVFFFMIFFSLCDYPQLVIGGGEGLSAVQLTRWLKNVNIVDGKKVNLGFRKIRVKESHVLKKMDYFFLFFTVHIYILPSR